MNSQGRGPLDWRVNFPNPSGVSQCSQIPEDSSAWDNHAVVDRWMVVPGACAARLFMENPFGIGGCDLLGTDDDVPAPAAFFLVGGFAAFFQRRLQGCQSNFPNAPITLGLFPPPSPGDLHPLSLSETAA